MLIIFGRETAEYIRCGDGPVRKTVNKLLSLNGCSSKEAREDKGQDKASLMKTSGCGIGRVRGVPSTSKVCPCTALKPFTNDITGAYCRQLWVQRTDFSFSNKVTTEMCPCF